MSDLSVVVISISVIVLCWAVVRLNQKLDEAIRKSRPNNDFAAWDDLPSQGADVTGNKAATPSV